MKHSQGKPPFAKKSLGQNFLADQNYINRIIDALHLTPNDTVIEIGPGRGALTDRLLEKAGRVVAIELDRDLVPVLNEKFLGEGNFEIVEQDALTVEFPDIVGVKAHVKLVANLPYYISTAILQHLIDQRGSFSEMVLMFQREVVDRITAPPGSSERGFLTVMTEAFLDSKKLFDVPPTAFRPVPKVWSSVISLTPRTGEVADEALLRTVASAAFAQKRKTILNNLKRIDPNAETALATAHIGPQRRAETLTAAEWAELVNVFEKLRN